MCFVSFLATLFFTTAFSMFSFNPFSLSSYYSLSFSKNVPPSSNRVKREDKINHIAVCSDFDKVEDSPFIAMILKHESGRLLCMGSIIDEYHVLTAKDCFIDIDVPSMMVVAGYASPYYGKNSQVKFVSKLSKHSQVNLAILFLSKPFTFGKTVQAIRIIGPEQIKKKVDNTTEFKKLMPFMVAGITLPSKLSPQRGELIPKGLPYQLKESEFLDIGGACTKKFTAGNQSKMFEKLKKIEDQNFCTDGESQFCWTAEGSPAVNVFQNIFVQVGMVVFSKCRFIVPTTKKPSGGTREGKEDDQLEYSPYLHIRLDWFWHWIKANSYVKDEFRLID